MQVLSKSTPIIYKHSIHTKLRHGSERGGKEQQEQKMELIYWVDRANTCDYSRAIAHKRWMVKCFFALQEFTRSNKHNAPISNIE